MSADLETILIYLQRRYNILREVCSLTEELAEAVERGDTVSASLLLDMRGEQLQRHADCEEQIILQTAGNSLQDRYLRDLAKGPLKNVKSCFKGKTEQEKMLEKRTGLPVVMWDERLTTVEAHRTMMESGVRREDRKKYVDKLAAVYILQGYLDHEGMKRERTQPE